MTRRELLALGASGLVLARNRALAADADLAPIARDAWLYTLPLIEMAMTRARLLARGATQNVLYHRRTLADHTSRDVTTPNNDTLYSTAWLDLGPGPVTVTLPAAGKRYLSFALMDMYTNNFAVLGTRTTGGDGGTFTIVGPDDAVGPSARNILRAPTPHVWALARVLVDGPQDLEAARAVQTGVALSGPRIDGGMTTVVARAAPWRNYFAQAQTLLNADRPPVTDAAMLRRIAPLGIGLDAEFKPEAFDSGQAARIEAGVAEARAIVVRAQQAGPFIQGWTYPRVTLGNFGQDYGLRALVALGGLAALPREEAMYMRAEGEGGSGLHDGSKAWRLHFPAGQQPPVDAFWSLSMYELTGAGQLFFIENPLKRYAIGDRTHGLTTNGDGSLDLWLGHENPGAAREANWLPAPPGPFSVTMRAYLPRIALLDGQYRLPPVTPAS